LRDKSSVIIKPKAFYKMLVHVLRFGNKVRDKNQYEEGSVEVMGMLIGRLEGDEEPKNVIVDDAIPISHGGSIEVSFTIEDYATFTDIEYKITQKYPDLFNVGWYHSHPNLGLFFSGTDIKNQMGFRFPSSIGIVFDHSLFMTSEEELGFKTFRLNDFSKVTPSNYHEVKTIIEPPDSLDFYVNLINLFNAIHLKQLPILEASETPDLIGEISIPNQDQLKSKKPIIHSEELLEQVKKGINGFMETSLKPIFEFLNEWSQKILVEIIKNNIVMRENLGEIIEIIKMGFSNLYKSIKTITSDHLSQLFTIFDYQSDLIQEHQVDSQKEMEELRTEIMETVNSFVQNNLMNPFNEKLENIGVNLEQMGKMNTNLRDMDKNIESFQNELKGLSGKFSLFNSTFNKSIDDNKTSYQEIRENNLKILEEKFDKVDEHIDILEDYLVNISKEIKNAIQKIKTKIHDYKQEKSSLEEKMKALTGERNALDKDLKKTKEMINELNSRLERADIKGGSKD